MRKILILIFTILNFLLYYLTFLKVEKIFYWLGLMLGLILIANLFLGPRKFFSQDFLAFFVFNLLFNFAGILFLVVNENQNLIYILLALLPIFNFLYWQLIYLFFYKTNDYSPFSLNRFFNYISLISFFFILSGIFAFNVFLNISPIFISLAVVVCWMLFFWIDSKIFKDNIFKKNQFFINLLLFF